MTCDPVLAGYPIIVAVACLQRVLRPSLLDHHRRIDAFTTPPFELTMFILHVEHDEGVWIGPPELCNRDLERDPFRPIVGRGAVVCPHQPAPERTRLARR